ncbi:MAG TPA: cytochrome c [Gemmatimonadaceae bacterium]|nr:cytochrome c [Gemmatimonadaceae bacterium]
MMLSSAVHFLFAAMNIQPAGAPSVWDQVYTAVQAERGKSVYEARCGRCHGDDLHGVNASPLAGKGFLLHWEGRTVERLFRKIADTMPPDAAGTLSGRDAIDTVAYVLQENAFPAGSTALAADPAALGVLEIKSAPGRPAVVHHGSLVESIGCLARDRDDGWLLIDATEPQAATLDAPPAARDAASPMPGGTHQIPLMNVFPNPAAHKGHTVRAKGFLIRQDAGDRINVVTLEMLDSRCRR